MTYNIKLLPARYGDCIWIEYGQLGNIRRVLIDGGTGGTKKAIKQELANLPPAERQLELLVVTHIDRDHIEGVLNLLEEENPDFTINEIWFNGWPHLPGNSAFEQFGAVQGERLTAAILKHRIPWNTSFGHQAVMVPAEGKLPKLRLGGGLEITLLSPYLPQLLILKKSWIAELSRANLVPGYNLEPPRETTIESFGVGLPDIELLSREPFQEDDAPANGSSIAFIASFGAKTVLFAGDALPGVLLQSLNRISHDSIPVDIVKLSHHASAGNTSPELIDKLKASRFAVSTNGSIYKHPSPATIARIIKQKGQGMQFLFNYLSEHNRVWKTGSLQEKYRFTSVYPEKEGVTIRLLD